MATYDVDMVRSVALEIHEKITALYASVLPIYTETTAWTLNNLDSLLPTPFEVRVQLAAYRTLALESLKLTDYDALVMQAEVSDTLAGGALSGLVPRTGSALLFHGTEDDIPTGWLNMDGQTIGDASSGADYANSAAYALFVLLWGRYPNTDLPIQDSTGVACERGASAADDWAAHTRLPLPNWPDQVEIFPGPGLGSVGCIVIIKL